jgi:hypothetical protein
MRAIAATLLFAALCAQSGAARAASIDFGASELRGNSVVATDLGPGWLAIDPAFVNAEPIDLLILLEAEDMGALLAWNALVDNLSGEVWSAFTIEVFDAAALHAHSVYANAGVFAGIDATTTAAVIHFDPAEAAGIDLGAPFGAGADWQVDVGDLDATSFRIRFAPLAVPESASPIAIGALAALAAGRRRSSL